MAMSCPICLGEKGSLHIAREMMFATNESFPYFECENCGCLSLQRIPENLGAYYQGDYYSFNEDPDGVLRRFTFKLCLSPLGFLFQWLPFPTIAMMPRLHLDRKMKLLDVGCGAGSFIAVLRRLGFQAQGIDPYVASEIRDAYGVRVWKRSLDEVDAQIDVLLFSHSLEHMPASALAAARRVITSAGLCVVRIPIVNWAWRHFGTNWVQLDAPRHLLLHTARSFQQLAEGSGFQVEKIVYDSVDFQFWGSEAHARGQSFRAVPRPGPAKRAQLRIRAMVLNHKGLGDQAQFYLRPI